MKFHLSIFIPFFLLLMVGCSWQKIPADPEYVKDRQLPLRVGLISAHDANSMLYVPGVVSELRSMRLFDSLLFPYHEEDQVDAVATLSVDGDWQPSGAGPLVAVGLTLGLASPFVGPSVTGTHIIKAALVSGSEDVGFYSSKVSTKAEWGVMADSNSVSQQTNTLQTKRLADALAKAIREDQNNLLAKVKLNSQENPIAQAYVPRTPKRIPREPPKVSSTSTPRPAVADQNPKILKQGLFSFEAEKLAIQQGCTTPGGIRPTAYLVKESTMLEIYSIDCQQGKMRVRCMNQICELER